MKAIIIEPSTQVIENIEIESYDDIVKQIGFDTIISDEMDQGQNRVYFDEECFLRGSNGRFQIDNLIPVSGVGIIVGASNENSSLSNVTTSIDNIQKRLKFL
ncbi:MAG: hypothetical protein HKN83_03600 [Gammaproteobacteria bacterium]|nr:hypothetical protein [Gammaproteobacteria bacterium]